MQANKSDMPQQAGHRGSKEAVFLPEHERILTATKHGSGAVFAFPRRVLSVQAASLSVSLRCATEAYDNSVVWTHETSMNQLSPHDGTGPADALNVTVTAWSPTIIRIQWTPHESLGRGNQFPPKSQSMLVGSPVDDLTVDVFDDDAEVRLETSALVVRIAKDPFHLAVYDRDQRLIGEQRRPDLFTADVLPMGVAEYEGMQSCFESLRIRPGDELYGLGERFDYVGRRGKVVDFWNKDAIGTSNRRTYINVPFVWSTQGYGVFLNSPAITQWEVGTQDQATLGFAVEQEEMDYFFIAGPEPAQILQGYMSLTGQPEVPPVWSFGLWMSRNSYQNWDVVHSVARRLRQEAVPCDVLHLDTAWFSEDWNCDLRFSQERFPNPERHIDQLRDDGFRLSLWQYNFVPPREDNANYVEGRERGFFAKNSEGQPFRHSDDKMGSWLDDAIIDFSNPEACRWYAGQVARLIGMGVAAIKTDFGEGIPIEAQYENIEGRRFHNLYSLVYNSVMHAAVKSVDTDAMLWARSGTAGSQRYPVHWGGDSQCSWEGLAGTLRGGLSLGLSGLPFFSHDIGGFIGRPSPELYVRWAQLGLFSSHARCHGAGNDNSREPWSFGEEAATVFRDFANLRYRLLPYIVDQARKAAVAAKPMLRALVVDFFGDRNTWGLDDQYMFGDALLVAPILEPMAAAQTRELYLPRGEWFDFWSGERVESGGEWVTRPVALETMPVFVKSGSVVPYTEVRQSTNNKVGPIRELHFYGDEAELDYHDGSLRFRAALSVESESEVPVIDPPEGLPGVRVVTVR